jgi:hypothetical protein
MITPDLVKMYPQQGEDLYNFSMNSLGSATKFGDVIKAIEFYTKGEFLCGVLSSVKRNIQEEVAHNGNATGKENTAKSSSLKRENDYL